MRKEIIAWKQESVKFIIGLLFGNRREKITFPLKFLEAKQWQWHPISIGDFRLKPFESKPQNRFVFLDIKLPELEMPSFFRMIFCLPFDHRAFWSMFIENEDYRHRQNERELFVLIKKLCVSGIQKPTTEFQFHFMFIFPLWVESPTWKPIAIPIKELNKSQMRNGE